MQRKFSLIEKLHGKDKQKPQKKKNEKIYGTTFFGKIEFCFFVGIQREIILETWNFHVLVKIQKGNVTFKIFLFIWAICWHFKF